MLAALGLDTAAESVYRALLDRPGRGVDELARHLGLSAEQVRAALDQLFELTLLRPSFETPGQLRAVSPDVGLQALLARQQEEVARRQLEVAASKATIASMIAEYMGRHNGSVHPDAERLVGMDAIHGRLEQLTESATTEVLSVMPGGAQSAEAIEAGRRNDHQLLTRGVLVRTVLLDSVRSDQPTLAYATWLAAAGSEVRTAAVLPPRMIVVDRQIALVPIDPEDSRAGAVQLAGAGLVAPLLALFEQVWATAVPLGASRARNHEGLTNVECALLKLLAAGLTDQAAAVRLGISERTTRRIMAELMERLHARSRFEAGLRAAKAGWL